MLRFVLDTTEQLNWTELNPVASLPPHPFCLAGRAVGSLLTPAPSCKRTPRKQPGVITHSLSFPPGEGSTASPLSSCPP